ncbi:MFS transporter [Vibrio penaeicida]|uniref:MFS transporter n=1 Tax=Vibrio penaeicida TaxID=104609 RepID=UPI000CEA2596|nr:MFS transporter [Vibrio penaeicida]
MNKRELTIRFGIQQGLHWLIMGIMIPVITLIFQSRGLNLFDIGLVMAVWIGSTALLEIPMGGLADKYGKRRTYLVSLFTNMVGCIVLLVSYDFSFLLMSSFILGASRALYSGTLDALFYESFQHQVGDGTFHSALAKVNVMITFGLAIGSLIGGVLPDVINNLGAGFPSVYDLNILTVIIGNVLLLAGTIWVIPNQKRGTSTDPSIFVSSAKSILRTIQCAFTHCVIKRLMQTTLVLGMVLSAAENHWQPYLARIIEDTGYGITMFGMVSSLYFLMSAVASLCSITLLTWFNGSHRMLMLVTRCMAGVLFFLLAHTTSFLAFLVCYLGFFFLFTLGNNSESVLLNDNTSEEVRSTMLSVSSFVVTIGGVLSSLVFGFISEHYGIPLSWQLSGILLVVSSFVLLFIPRSNIG